MNSSFDTIVGVLVKLAIGAALSSVIVLPFLAYYSYKLVALFKKYYYNTWAELTAKKTLGPALSLPYFSIIPYVYSRKFQENDKIEKLKHINKKLFITLILLFMLPFIFLFIIFILAIFYK